MVWAEIIYDGRGGDSDVVVVSLEERKAGLGATNGQWRNRWMEREGGMESSAVQQTRTERNPCCFSFSTEMSVCLKEKCVTGSSAVRIGRQFPRIATTCL